MNRRYCKTCGKVIWKASKYDYCREHYREHIVKEDFEKWKNNELEIIDYRRFKWSLLEHQNHKCKICGIEDKWNDRQLVFIMDHIDGNAENDKFENIRMICPNCDSQLDTFKSRNRISARRTIPYVREFEKNLVKERLSEDEI